MANKQKNTLVKNKLGPALGFRTPDFVKQSRFSGGKANMNQNLPKFNPAQFKTQHKGG